MKKIHVKNINIHFLKYPYFLSGVKNILIKNRHTIFGGDLKSGVEKKIDDDEKNPCKIYKYPVFKNIRIFHRE